MYDKVESSPTKTEVIQSLMERSIIVQAVITVAVVITSCVLAIMQKPIPDPIEAGLMLLLGFYFGSKISIASGK